MAKKSKTKRQQDLHRRLAEGSTEAKRAREDMLKDLGDPERFAQGLRVFSHLALLMEGLHRCRFPTDAFIDAVVGAKLPDAPDETQEAAVERGRALRQAVIPGLASEALLSQCQDAIHQTIATVNDRDPLLALAAAGTLATSCLQAGAPSEHPFWDILFEVTLTESLLSSQFLIRLVHGSLAVDQDEVARVFARELAQGEIGTQLVELGLDSPDAGALAKSYAALVADRDPHHFQYDAVLHLSGLHVELAESLGKQIAVAGLSTELLEGAKARAHEAYLQDVTEHLVGEVAGWYRGHLEALRDRPEEFEGKLPRPLEVERERCLVIYLSLGALPVAENALLEAIYMQSLARSRVGVAADEAPFVGRLWSNPTDSFALEEYEKYLLAKQEKTRSRRVRRFREETRKARLATGSEGPV